MSKYVVIVEHYNPSSAQSKGAVAVTFDDIEDAEELCKSAERFEMKKTTAIRLLTQAEAAPFLDIVAEHRQAMEAQQGIFRQQTHRINSGNDALRQLVATT